MGAAREPPVPLCATPFASTDCTATGSRTLICGSFSLSGNPRVPAARVRLPSRTDVPEVARSAYDVIALFVLTCSIVRSRTNP